MPARNISEVQYNELDSPLGIPHWSNHPPPLEESRFVLKCGSVSLPNHLLTIAYGKQGKAEAKNKGLNEEDERVDNEGQKRVRKVDKKLINSIKKISINEP